MPFDRHGSGRARRRAAERRYEIRAAAPGLADFACRRVAPSRRQRRDERGERRPGRVGQQRQHGRDRRDAGIRERVAGAAPAASILGDPEQRLAAQAEPGRHHGERKRREEERPSAPPGGQENRDAERRADQRARRGDGPREITGGRDAGIDRHRRGQRGGGRGRGRDDQVFADQRPAPQHRSRGRRHRDVVVEPDRDGLHRRRRKRRRERHRQREPQIRRRDDRRPAPPAQERRGRAAGQDERDAARHGLLAVPREARAPEMTAGQRRHAVAEREHAPRRRHDVPPIGQREEQQQNGDRVERDARVVFPRRLGRAIQPISGNARERVQVEGDCHAGQHGPLPPADVAQQQREAAHRDVDQFPAVFGEARPVDVAQGRRAGHERRVSARAVS